MLHVSQASSMMEQWQELKNCHPDALLLFQLGDFFEAFYDDAAMLGAAINVAITQRQNIPMAGIPVKQLSNYIEDIVRYSQKVAIAEQISEQNPNQGITHRGITKIITPGTIIEKATKAPKKHMFLAIITAYNNAFAICFTDISTGELFGNEAESIEDVVSILYKYSPEEIIITSGDMSVAHREAIHRLAKQEHINCKEELLSPISNNVAKQFLMSFFNVQHLTSLGLDQKDTLIQGVCQAIKYIQMISPQTTKIITTIQISNLQQHLLLAKKSLLCLDILKNQHTGNIKGTLIDVIDYTISPQGGRLLKLWLSSPLISQQQITNRVEIVEFFKENPAHLSKIQNIIKQLPDFQRLASKITSGSFNPQDLHSLLKGVCSFKDIRPHIDCYNNSLFQHIIQIIDRVPPMFIEMLEQLNSPTPNKISGLIRLIKPQINKELDVLYDITTNSDAIIDKYVADTLAAYDLKTLKYGNNRVIGSFLETTKTQCHKLPSPPFNIIQNLNSYVRITSDFLKNITSKQSEAEFKTVEIEEALFFDMQQKVLNNISIIQAIAKSSAILDCLQSLATTAHNMRWCRPSFPNKDSKECLTIIQGYHPAVYNNSTTRFVKNDIHMTKESYCLFITGPNMAGKSTYIRQIALIIILAQIGSFVPADKACLPIIQAIFTRIGANDNISEGQSTFMVEMAETATILNNLQHNTLVIIDEIGRGTSPDEGIAIATAILEYIIQSPFKPYTLFATHYHNIIDTLSSTNAIQKKTFQCTITKCGSIIFHYHITAGVARHSFAIPTAKIAGLPDAVITLATQILNNKVNQ